MVEHFVYTEGVGSSSLSPPKAYVERHSKDAALVFGVGDFGDLLYIFYSGEQIIENFRTGKQFCMSQLPCSVDVSPELMPISIH